MFLFILVLIVTLLFPKLFTHIWEFTINYLRIWKYYFSLWTSNQHIQKSLARHNQWVIAYYFKLSNNFFIKINNPIGYDFLRSNSWDYEKRLQLFSNQCIIIGLFVFLLVIIIISLSKPTIFSVLVMVSNKIPYS